MSCHYLQKFQDDERLKFEQFFHLRLHRFIHLDERRPRAFETFAGNFLRRVQFHFFLARRFPD